MVLISKIEILFDTFQAQYKNDIDFLRKNYPNIKFLSPPLW